MKYEKVVFIGDIHIPFHEEKIIKTVIKFIHSFKPNHIFLLGDVLDFYSISSYDKEPSRITSLQTDINITKDLLKTIRKDNKNSEITYLEGNHEHRLQKYLWKHPEISSLNALNIKNLLNLDEYNIKYINQHKTKVFHKFVIEHGSLIRQQSAYTAKAMLMKRGISGISGHTHRLGTHYASNMNGNFVWYENGCLSNLNPDFVIGKPDWMHGFSVGYIKRKTLSIEQIPILNKKIMYDGIEYK